MNHQCAIEYTIGTESDCEGMVRVLSEAFSLRDPPAVAIGLSASEFEVFVRSLCPNVADGLTTIARDVATGQVIGALLAEDPASSVTPDPERLSPKFLPIFDLLGRLDAAYRDGRVIHPGDSLHLYLLGVSERYCGRGIGREMVARCTANGAGRGYRVAVTEATNRRSQSIFRREGFVERVRESYRDHRFEGRAWFAGIADHGGPMLMDKILIGAGGRSPAPQVP